MTPLAMNILNDTVRPVRERAFEANGSAADVGQALLDAHAFDLTAVREMIPELGLRMYERMPGGLVGGLKEKATAFLPAPTTWIEFAAREHRRQRFGLLLQESGEFALATICIGDDHALHCIADAALPLSGSDELGEMRRFPPLVPWAPQHLIDNLVRDIYPMLAVINSPKVIGRRQIMPHSGLQRRLAAARGSTGKYPLRAWTEIILRATPTYVDESGVVHEASLTGKKCLHFCRAHLRIQAGKLIIVSAHWRGDPALGIKRARYKILPPTQ